MWVFLVRFLKLNMAILLHMPEKSSSNGFTEASAAWLFPPNENSAYFLMVCGRTELSTLLNYNER
jgi:hypothetical protein